MNQFLRSGQPAALMVFALVILVIKLVGFWVVSAMVAGSEQYSSAGLHISYFDTVSPFLNFFFTTLFTLVFGFLLNAVIEQYAILGKKNYLLFLSYGLLMSTSPTLLYFTYIHVISALFIMLLAMVQRFSVVSNPFSMLFEYALILSLALLIDLRLAVLLVLFYIGLNTYHPFNLKHWLMPILGLATFFYLYVSLLYLFDYNVSEVLGLYFAKAFQFKFELLSTGLDALIGVGYLLCFVVPLINYFFSIRMNKVRVSKLYIWNLYALFLLFAFGVIFTGRLPLAVAIISPGLALVFTVFALRQLSSRITLLVLIALTGLVISSQFITSM